MAPVESTALYKIGPLACDPEVGFVRAPRPIGHPQFPAAAPVEFRRVTLHPTPDRDVIDGEVPLGHDLFQISEAEPKPPIPAYTQDDDLGFKMSPF